MSHAGSHIMMLYHMLAHISWYCVTWWWLTHHDIVSHAVHTSWYCVTCWLTYHDIVSHDDGSHIMILCHMLLTRHDIVSHAAHTWWYVMSVQVKTVFNIPKFAAHLGCASKYQFLLSIKHWSKKPSRSAEWFTALCLLRAARMVVGLRPKSPPMPYGHVYRYVDADLYTVGKCCTRGESQEFIARRRQSTQARDPLGFQTQGRRYQKSITGALVAPWKGVMPSKNF